ncbi:EscV/YscV/HrcV family type III secretion system export apparatus protein [Burkholderia sp. WAC0059]|uniref:FHIPEP family type III secretion protein n=1 Tax=Burkholderia sp. WAC0059 TaxID=2066022 RepID=UPI000C7F72C8|nr:EscV/YscV/HrcV family type III secretion system export apparatus protein [Burkholderia sp. WAC0059]
MMKTLRLPASGEVGIAALIVAIVSLMILPLPPELIDGLLAINICISVTLLMVTLYISDISALSAFPSLLLFTTLYRLSLNIASTKSILLHADAGHIIESFGELVVGGNLVVGLVVFVIIATVQFIVIAKGSERVAEVGARFTLDALPGKQMSIDADLRANIITPEEARRKRSKLALESQLHGGMDGAMKFVKGDAIAGLIITLVNIVAGIAVGIAYHGMSAGDAANRFSILSVGDAMVSQIPSLLISVAAGVLITRVAEDNDHDEKRSLGDEISRQLGGNARALYCASLLLLGFAAVPGFPAPLFVLLSGTLGFVGYRLSRNQRAKDDQASGKKVSSLQRAGAKGDAPSILPRTPQFSSPVGVRLAAELVAKLDVEKLDRAFDAERAKLQAEIGLPFPGIAMWSSAEPVTGDYEILIYDVPYAGTGIAAAGGEAARDGEDADKAAAGAQATATEEIVARETIALLRRHAHLFLGIQETQWILDQLGTDYPGLVAEVQKALPLQRIADVLRRLLEESISIRNARSIMESLIVWGPKEKDMLMLTEYVRCDLSRFIAHRATGGSQRLSAVLLDRDVEQRIRQSIKQTPTGNFLALPPDEMAYLVERVTELVGAVPREGVAAVASMDIRRYVRRMVEARIHWLPVYSYQELGEQVELQPIGELSF